MRCITLAVLTLLTLQLGCDSKSATPTTFYCRNDTAESLHARECTNKEGESCKQGGCFERPEAYCFITGILVGKGTMTICSPTMTECEQWLKERRNAYDEGAHPKGSCVLMKPDEYFYRSE